MEYSCFTMLCQFQMYSKVNELYIYVYLLSFRFFPCLSHYRVSSRILCAIKQVLISYPFYIQNCVYVNPTLPIYSSLLFPWELCLFSKSVTVFLFCKQVLLYLFKIPHVSNIIWSFVFFKKNKILCHYTLNNSILKIITFH